MKYQVQIRRVWHEALQFTVYAASQTSAEIAALEQAADEQFDWNNMDEVETSVEYIYEAIDE